MLEPLADRGGQEHRTGVNSALAALLDQLTKPRRRPIPKVAFIGASGLTTRFRRIEADKAECLASHPYRVAVDHVGRIDSKGVTI